MGLNNNQVRELLRWYVNSSKTREEYHIERMEELKKNKKWINPEVIRDMPFDELKEHYLEYYNSGTGKKQNINAIHRDRIIKDPKFRNTILYLFDESLGINERLNNIINGEKHISGMNRALSTAFLMDYKPDKYCLWNAKTDAGLAVLGWDDELHKWGESHGDRYLKVLNIFKKLKNLDPQLKLDYIDLDLFLHTIAATDEGIVMVEKISNNSSNLRYFIKKTLTDYNSKEQKDIDEIRFLFERRIPKFLEKIANETLTNNDLIYKAKGGTGSPQINSVDEMSYLPQIELYLVSKERGKFYQYYILYKLREDRKGMYLSLNHSQSFMKGVLEEKGEYDGWFKDNFENGLKIAASNAMNTLNFKPEGFLETMDLGAKNAKSGRMYEAATVYAKYYTLDNLPTEEVLVSDFKELLRLYDLLVGKDNILKIIENPEEIKEAQNKFLAIMYNKSDEVISTEKFDLGPKMTVEAHWSNELGIYVVNRELEDPSNRYMNAFGIHKPDANFNLSVVCEINIPKDGANRNVAGAFAKDLEGNIYLIHRGNIADINKTKFFDKFSGEMTQTQEGNTKTDAVLIGKLNDPKLPEDVRNFVFEVAQIKGLLDNKPFKPFISNFLENVFKYYPRAKTKGIPVVDSNLSKIFIGFKNDLKEFANKLPYGDTINKYETNSIHSGKGKWIDYPHVYIYDINLRKQDKYDSFPYFVKYVFSKDLQEVYLTLRLTWSYADLFLEDTKGEYNKELRNDYFKTEASKARAKLLNLGKISKEFNWDIPEDPYDDRIYIKGYKKGHLPTEKVLQNDLIEIISLYQDLIHGEQHNNGNNIRNSLQDLLKNYKKAKDGETSEDEKLRIDHLLGIKFPNYLKKFTQNKYQIFSSDWDKWHFCPYVAIMDEKVSLKHNEGLFVNYMLREDMSGVYLALRQGVKDIKEGEYYKNYLKSKSVEYRDIISQTEVPPNFTDKIDLKYTNAKYAPFYEVGTVFAKFYEANKLPSEEELESDLNEMLNLYDILIESVINKFKSFNDYLNTKNFLYSPEMVENFLLSLKVKPFVILTGNSGTGKTKIAQLFAEYLNRKNIGNYIIIPVGANWTENRHLMGFYNVITGDYQSTPALDLIINASYDKTKPYFLILDEMNLSHVERYFSDFLSAMESGEKVSLYSSENAKNIKNIKVPEKLKVPENLFVIGTVNVDETTYMFSPKVLDRANTIEFTTYPANEYIMCEIEPEAPKGDIDFLENVLSNLETREFKIKKLKDLLSNVKVNKEETLWDILALKIHSFQEILSEAGFDFGFRVIDEIMRFMYVAWLYEGSPSQWDNWQRYFDVQIMQKMLPKLHGSQRELGIVLEKLFKLCYVGELNGKLWYSVNLEENDSIYPVSAKKLQKMGKTLQEKRFVSFTD